MEQNTNFPTFTDPEGYHFDAAVPSLKRPVVSLSPRRPGLNPRPGQVGSCEIRDTGFNQRISLFPC